MQDAEPPPSRNGRRALIALIVLLLVLLPLYLWPLRGGLAGLRGTSALPGSVRDPRSAAAVAQIPGDVWDALMGHTDAPPSPPSRKPPRNLTMITHGGGIPGGGLDEGAVGSTVSDTTPAFARGMLAQLGSADLPGGTPAGDTASTSEEFSTSSPGGGSGGPSNGVGLGSYPGFGNLGPWPGGGGGGAPRLTSLGPTFDPGGPGDPGTLQPTPEPATLALVGSNLALLGVAAWRRRRRRLGISAPG
jgi:hypothetical protein